MSYPPPATPEIAAALDRIARNPNRAAGLAPFEQWARRATIASAIERACSSRRPVIGTLCAMVPNELIHAAGAIPIRLCGGSAEDAGRAEAVPDLPLHRDTCPLVKSCCGAVWGARAIHESPLQLMIVPATCDWKVRLGEVLGARAKVIVLDLPRHKDAPTAQNLWRREVVRLAQAINELPDLPRRITRDTLRASILTYRRATRAGRRLALTMRADDPPIRGAELAMVFGTAFYEPIEDWTAAAQALADELEQRVAASQGLAGEDTGCPPQSSPRRRGEGRSSLRACGPTGARAGGEGGGGPRSPLVRLLVAGSPSIWPNIKLLAIAEDTGAVVVSDESCAGARMLWDAVALDEPTLGDMLNAVADRYFLPCTCPCFTPNDERLYRLRTQVEDFRVDGVLYHVLKSCFVYDAELPRVTDMFSSLGTPVLRIETDYSPEDTEQLRLRIEAFVEVLGARQALANRKRVCRGNS